MCYTFFLYPKIIMTCLVPVQSFLLHIQKISSTKHDKLKSKDFPHFSEYHVVGNVTYHAVTNILK